MTDLNALEKELAALTEKVTAERARVKHETLEALRAMLESGTLTPADLIALLPEMPKAVKPRVTRSAHPPMFRDPVSGNTWSGKGNIPAWIKDKNRDDFLINKAA